MNNDQLRKSIYIRAIARLAARDYSKKGLETKLVELKKRYPRNKLYPLFTQTAVREVVESLAKEGLINEERAIRNAFESSLSGKYGLRRISLKLMRKGYPKELIEKAAKEVKNLERDFERIEETVQKKYDQLVRKAEGDRKKMFQISARLKAFLFNRGFSMEEIDSVISKIKK